MAEKYLYFRSQATDTSDDDANDSVCYPASSLVGMAPGSRTTVVLRFRPLTRGVPPPSVLHEDNLDNNDTVTLTVTTETQAATMKAITNAIVGENFPSFLVIANDDSGSPEYLTGSTITSCTIGTKADYAESSGTDAVVVAAAGVTLDSSTNVEINADSGTINFKDASASLGTITSAGYTGDVVGNASTATTAGTVTTAAQPAIESIGTDGDTLNILGDNLIMANSTASKPLVTIDNSSTSQQHGGTLEFKLADTNTFLGSDLTVGQITASAYDITDEDYLPISRVKFDTLGTGSNNDIPGIIKFGCTSGNGTLVDQLSIQHGRVDIGNLYIVQKLSAGQVLDFTPTFLVVADCTAAATLANRREYMVNDADGGALVLPTVAEGYRIIINIGTTITSNTITITAASGDLLKGYAFMERTDAANNKTYFAPDGTNDLIITLNGSTKGGLVGDKIELVGISGTEWRVRATLSHTGSAVNPFS